MHALLSCLETRGQETGDDGIPGVERRLTDLFFPNDCQPVLGLFPLFYTHSIFLYVDMHEFISLL